jgi:hypothetical protein
MSAPGWAMPFLFRPLALVVLLLLGSCATGDGTGGGAGQEGSAATLCEAIQEALGPSNRDVPRLGTCQEGNEVLVSWAIDENLTEGLTKDSARVEAVDILKAISDWGASYRSIRIEGTYPLVDEFGNATEETVVEAVYRRRTVQQINFGGFDFKNAFEIADFAQVHPAFQY